MRYLTKSIQKDLKSKMVILAGPRQCGKTTLAKELLGTQGVYLNWDIAPHRKIIREISWPKNASIVVLDELHKAPKWKNYLKGLSDEFKNSPPLLVTGSAKLDAFRQAGDALTGRNYFYRLHPVDVSESKSFLKNLDAKSRVQLLLETGGFPEALLNPKDSKRLRNDRLELVLKEDLRDLTRVLSWRGPSDLVELLRERVGKPVSYEGLSQDLRVSPPTVKSWIELLEKLYIIFQLNSHSQNLARGIRKEKRVFFYDCASAYDDSGGSQLENLVASCLLKKVQFLKDTTGENWDLQYLKDKEKREVDFVVTKNRKPETLIEVKQGEERIGNGLKYYHEKLKPKKSIQLVLNLTRKLQKDEIHVEPLAEWLDHY